MRFSVPKNNWNNRCQLNICWIFFACFCCLSYFSLKKKKKAFLVSFFFFCKFTFLHPVLYASYCIFSSLSFWDGVTFTSGFASSYFISFCGLVFPLRSFLWALFFAVVFPEMPAVLDFYKSWWHVFNHNFCLLFNSHFSGDFSSLGIGFFLTVFFLFLVSCIDFVLFFLISTPFPVRGVPLGSSLCLEIDNKGPRLTGVLLGLCV